MTIDEMMTVVVNDLVKLFGTEHIISRGELISLMYERYRVPHGSTIPSDYCYNRTNNGITLKKPPLLEFLGGGQYRCLGTGFPYNGPIYHKSRETNTELIVGECRNGERFIAGLPVENEMSAFSKRNPRYPSARLRVKVLARDKSTCQICGATAPSVELHVDHIIPYSKGGTTTLDNLQTLCSKCNLGKGNLLPEDLQ